jgi:dTDP-4-amino-4,6-dideoxygalactose transaminase
VKKAISAKTKAIMPVHLFGQCADMEPMLEMSKQHDIPIVDDAAQAIGAEYKGNRIGNIGTLGCFSFFPSKNLGAFGDAGMITTNDEILAEKLRIIRHQGTQPKYHHKTLGGNFRLDALQAAVLRVKLKYLPEWTEERGKRAAYYTERLVELGPAPEKVTPPKALFDSHIFNYYVIKAKDRDGLKEYLAEHNVASEIYYPVPMHLQECINTGQYKQGDFPICEKACKDVLALPIYPELTQEQQEYVVQMIYQYYKKM